MCVSVCLCYQRPCVASATYLGVCLYKRPERLRRDKRRVETQLRGCKSMSRSEQGRSPLSLCQSVPTTSSSLPLLFLSPEEKNKEKDKAGDNSTDATQGTLCVRTGELESSHLNFQFCALFSTPIPIQLCYLLLPMPPGVRERTTERQGFLGMVRPDGAC